METEALSGAEPVIPQTEIPRMPYVMEEKLPIKSDWPQRPRY